MNGHRKGTFKTSVWIEFEVDVELHARYIVFQGDYGFWRRRAIGNGPSTRSEVDLRATWRERGKRNGRPFVKWRSRTIVPCAMYGIF
jgi:hypothetical protein